MQKSTHRHKHTYTQETNKTFKRDELILFSFCTFQGQKANCWVAGKGS